MKKEKFDVTGMTCSACSARVERSVSKLNGVSEVSVNLLTNSMQVQYDEAVIGADGIVAAVEHAGYGASPTEGYGAAVGDAKGGQSAAKAAGQASSAAHGAAQSMKQRLIVSLIFWVPLMYVSMHHMFQMWFGIPTPAFVVKYLHGDSNSIAFAFTQFLLLLPILYMNRKYFQVGFKTLFHGSPNMDSLVAVGSGAAIVYGIYAIYCIGYGMGYGDLALVQKYNADLYFESAGTILTLITVGKYMEARSKSKTTKAIETLMDMAPKMALVERGGRTLEIPVESVVQDDIVLVKPGAAVPVDGVIVEGSSSIDESVITGESIPVEKTVGDTAVSATINKSGFFKMRATKVGADTTINQIIRLVDEASSSKAPIAKLADRIAGVFVPTVIGIALITFVVWLLLGESFVFALSMAISVLVVSCPCALGLATPVAIMVGTGKGAENGILIKSGEALELAHSVDTVVMDKTGTITEGKPVVTDVVSFGVKAQELLLLAQALEAGSEHPLAEAVMNYAEQALSGETKLHAEDFAAVHGQGVYASIDGTRYLAGNRRMMEAYQIPYTAEAERYADRFSDEGKTPLIFADEARIIGMIAVSDVEKQSSAAAIEKFRNMGIDVVMLTGDNERVAKAIQKRLNIPKVIAGVLPEDKEKHIKALQDEGHIVAMIGDGINDAPALARANVGIAIGAGTQVAIESADAVLIRNDLLDAVTAIRLSKAVIRNIKENLFWAFFYNCIGIPLAAGLFFLPFGIKLNPMFGAAAMSLSSVCVVTNALRLRFFRSDRLTGGAQGAKAENSPAEVNVTELSCDAQSEQKTADADAERAAGQAAESAPCSVSAETMAAVDDRQAQNEKQNEKQDKKQEGKQMRISMTVEGMMCQHCVKHVTKALEGLAGAQDVKVVLEDNAASFVSTADIDDAAIIAAIDDAGYTVKNIQRA